MNRLLFRCGGLLLLCVLLGVGSASSQEATAADPPGSQAAENAQQHRDLLAFIRIPAGVLPEGVRLVDAIRTAPMIPVTRNPDVLTDPQQFRAIALFFGMRDKRDLEPVRACGVAVYQENAPRNEIGVYALRFCDEKAAERHFEKLVGHAGKRARHKEPLPHILKGTLILYVWKDAGASGRAFEAVRDYFKTADDKPSPRPGPGASRRRQDFLCLRHPD